MTISSNVIEISHLKTVMGDTVIHTDINLSIKKGEILAIVGGSGSGKTTLLREILWLLKPSAGTIKIFDTELNSASEAEFLKIQHRWGVLFQQNALFSSFTVLENVAFPLKEFTKLDSDTINQLAMLKIQLVGLPEDAAHKYPSQLSGGMCKRAALARAIIMDPELLFLDEPTSGLDPTSAGGFDELLHDLQSTLNLTVIMVTHDVDTLWQVVDRVAFLGEGKVLCVAPMKELIENSHPAIKEFFTGPRGRDLIKLYEHK